MLSCFQIIDEVVDPADTITLDETARNRRRIKMVSDNGIAFLLNLPKAHLLQHGQGLRLNDGRVIEICAEPEALMKVCSKDGKHLLALAWQIGNRHLAAQIETDHILIRQDTVIREMLVGLGADVILVNAPFSPEGGAYGGQHHAHDH